MANNVNDLSKVKTAVSRLTYKQPFFSCLLLSLLKIEMTDSIPTAATNGRKVFINSKFFDSLDIDECVFVIAHEVMHVILDHCPRLKAYIDRGIGPDLKKWDSMKWNKATDYIINDWLVNADVGTMPECGLYSPYYKRGDIADEVYCKLKDDDESEKGGGWGDHMPANSDEAPTKAEIQQAVASAASAAKARGLMPSGAEILVNDICETHIPWNEKIVTHIVRCAGRDAATWTRVNRRKLVMPPHALMPGRTGHRAGHIVVYTDTSGSVSDREQSHFFGGMIEILNDLNPERLSIGSVDAAATPPVDIEYPEDIQAYKPQGGGGTDMGQVFVKLEEEHLFPDVCIIMTDGYTPWGEQPSYPVIWVITANDIDAPFGTNIHLDIRS